eukprot:UN01037
MQVLSAVPVMWSFWIQDPRIAKGWCEAQNDILAKQIRRGNEIAGCKRFVGFATVPLQFPEIAAGELRRLKKLEGIVGIQICTHCPKFEEPVSDFNFEGRYDLGHLKFEPLWKCASELSTPIFLHPWYMYYFNGENHMTTLPHGEKFRRKEVIGRLGT